MKTPPANQAQDNPALDTIYDLASYDYSLPAENIAQTPAPTRDASRLLVMDCRADQLLDRRFTDIIGFLEPGDLLVANDTKVFPARLRGRKESGGQVELFLLEYPRPTGTGITVTGLLRSSKRPRPGARLLFSEQLSGRVVELLPDGKVKVTLEFQGDPDDILADCGSVPLPPYIRRDQGELPGDRERYQTLFASHPGAVAAPTAGLHFTESLLKQIKKKDIEIATLTLHVGYGTFAPVRVTDIREHRIHEEYIDISAETARLVNRTKKAGGRIWAVGTTTARALEFAATGSGHLEPGNAWCGLYIYPGYRFKLVDNLITNFHLPRSSLLFLVAALAGRARILRAYHEAIRLDYRFYSYGDAMAIIT